MQNETRKTMNGKPVFTVPAKSVINFTSGFGHKLLCDSLTFTAGSACAYSCTFCYVEDLMQKNPHWRAAQEANPGKGFSDVVIRRTDTVKAIRDSLTDRHGNPRYLAPMPENRKEEDKRLYGPAVIYASPLVDVAANMELVNETVEICKTILLLTPWHIRLLSKSHLLPKIAQALDGGAIPCGCESHQDFRQAARERIIYGVSTGTLDDKLAQAFEVGTALVSKRIASLHWLQDNGFRTYGMICPSLPMGSYGKFALDMADALRADKCEHIWGEVINARGDSFTRTYNAINEAGFTEQAVRFHEVSNNANAWEAYARATFEAHAWVYRGALGPDGKPKLRFLQYVTKATRQWWKDREPQGAILL
jgi:DNA repair photolyase